MKVRNMKTSELVNRGNEILKSYLGCIGKPIFRSQKYQIHVKDKKNKLNNLGFQYYCYFCTA
ncbi:hypothetical protein DB895_11465 [Flavobacterium psychrotolerans]|uniref:Uncharacterized protein n=1 Tax=Flavobacterium psychrotolerans TaxID=2169410 RepID=A0A2U1JH67_9FLAO|nr:hypothetical protein DB895_11465 [Flavobacterium psychrotolerans]